MLTFATTGPLGSNHFFTQSNGTVLSLWIANIQYYTINAYSVTHMNQPNSSYPKQYTTQATGWSIPTYLDTLVLC